jgi:PAS domain S-box-containing protein
MKNIDSDLQLKQSQESLEFALQSGRMGTWDIDLESSTITCSHEMLELWGVEGEFNGDRSTLQKKVHPDDVEMMKKTIDKAIEQNTIYELEYRIIPSPGIEKWVLSRGRCSFNPNSILPSRFAGIVYDITERKLKEKMLEDATAIRDQFFMMASHELRTPLTSLQLQIQVAEWELANLYPSAFTAERLQAGLNKQKKQLLRITRIVDNILDETKIFQNKMQLHIEGFDLGDMVKDVLSRFRVMADVHDVEIKYTHVSGIVGHWDRFRIEQVLLNILINAIRYGNKKPVAIELTNENDLVLVSIRDQGIGIRPEDQERIFDRFERAISDSTMNGMGLGLFISKNIIEAHGGQILVKSALDEGSVFTIVLPQKR